MTELRAPDPTLTALGPLSDVVVQHGAVPLRAHRIADVEVGESVRDYVTGCGLRSLVTHQAQHARWYALPCRECFPDAPPPGTRPLTHVGGTEVKPGHYTTDCGLAWQVQS